MSDAGSAVGRGPPNERLPMFLTMQFIEAPVMDQVTVRLGTPGATFDLTGTKYPQECFFLDGGGYVASLGGVALAPLAFGFSVTAPSTEIIVSAPFVGPAGMTDLVVNVLVPAGVPFTMSAGQGPALPMTGSGSLTECTLPTAQPPEG